MVGLYDNSEAFAFEGVIGGGGGYCLGDVSLGGAPGGGSGVHDHAAGSSPEEYAGLSQHHYGPPAYSEPGMAPPTTTSAPGGSKPYLFPLTLDLDALHHQDHLTDADLDGPIHTATSLTFPPFDPYPAAATAMHQHMHHQTQTATHHNFPPCTQPTQDDNNQQPTLSAAPPPPPATVPTSSSAIHATDPDIIADLRSQLQAACSQRDAARLQLSTTRNELYASRQLSRRLRTERDEARARVEFLKRERSAVRTTEQRLRKERNEARLVVALLRGQGKAGRAKGLLLLGQRDGKGGGGGIDVGMGGEDDGKLMPMEGFGMEEVEAGEWSAAAAVESDEGVGEGR